MKVRIRSHGDFHVCTIRNDDGRAWRTSPKLPSVASAMRWSADQGYPLLINDASNLRSLDGSLVWMNASGRPDVIVVDDIHEPRVGFAMRFDHQPPGTHLAVEQ